MSIQDDLDEQHAREKLANCNKHLLIPGTFKFGCVKYPDRTTTWKDCMNCIEYERSEDYE